ncbi:hypothetical protein ACFE04_013146 [Oxalis oulophora]
MLKLANHPHVLEKLDMTRIIPRLPFINNSGRAFLAMLSNHGIKTASLLIVTMIPTQVSDRFPLSHFCMHNDIGKRRWTNVTYTMLGDKELNFELWDVYNMQNEDDQFYIELILLDENGSPIHAVIRKNLNTKYKQLLYEGRIYDIKNFKVIHASDNYKPIKGDFKALFLLTTNVTELKHHPTDIPMYYFQFASYQQLQDRVGERSILTNIIGKVVAIGKLEDRMANGRDNKIRRLQLLITE